MNPNPDIERLATEGYAVEIREGHIILHDIPYVDSLKSVQYGKLVAEVQTPKPDGLEKHWVWFIGEMPCDTMGVPLRGIGGAGGATRLGASIHVDRMFSTKPTPPLKYADNYAQLKKYMDLICEPAMYLNPGVSPRQPTPQTVAVREETSVFTYYDTASLRGAIQYANNRFIGMRVALVGVGGTGSYILDLVAKTHVEVIDLFDGKPFSDHNAFRAPGVASKAEVEQNIPKVEYYAKKLEAFRSGVVPHNCFLTAENLSLLDPANFVFLCVDDGPSRGLLADYLMQRGIPFIDCGMGLHQSDESVLTGLLRVTAWFPGDQAPDLPTAPSSDLDLYRSAIQTADANALSAALAVAHWKRYVGFYRHIGDRRGIFYDIQSSTVAFS